MYVRKQIAEMAGYVPGEQPQGGKFVKLNTNENPYPPSAKVGQAINQAVEAGLARYPDPLATSFRIQAAEVLGVEPDWILCGNGSDDILTIVTRAMVGEGERLRLPYPSYVLYKTLAEIQGARFEEVHFTPHWRLDDRFTKADDVKVAFLPNPNSPSGTMIPPEEIARLAEALPCPLLVDEAYADFAETNCMDLVRDHENVLVSRSLSKAYSLAGLRFGFVVAQPAMIEQLMKVKDSYNCDTLAIAGATAAIGDRAWQRENRAKVVATRERLTSAVKELGFDPPESQANFVWCPHPKLEVKPLFEALKENRILVRYMNYAGWGDGLRISVGTDEQVDACLSVLQSLI